MIAHVDPVQAERRLLRCGAADSRRRTRRRPRAEIPSIKRLRLGKRVKHGLPGYEQAMREDFEYSVIVEVDDLEGLKAYLAHPLHKVIGSTSRSRRLRRWRTTTRCRIV